MPVLRICFNVALAVCLVAALASAEDREAALISWLEQVPDDIDFSAPAFDDWDAGTTEYAEDWGEEAYEDERSGLWQYPDQFQLMGIYPLDPAALDEHGTPAYCRSCNRPGCGAFGCGTCGGGCVTPTWFAGAEFVALGRDSARRLNLSGIEQIVFVNDQPIPVQIPIMSTKDLDFKFEPGMRLTVGRFLGTDFLKRVHSLEFSYLGLFDYSASHQVSRPPITQEFFGVPVFTIGEIFSFFPQSTSAFTAATMQRAEYSSNMNNFELNYRIRKPLGRDSFVARTDNTWFRRCTTGFTPSFLFGLRYMSVSEDFWFYSEGPRIFYDQQGQPIFDEMVTGTYNIRSTNDMVGAQIGGDLTQQFCRFNVAVRGKAGLYSNWVSQTSVIRADDDFFFPENPSRAFGASGQHAAFIGELGFVGNYHIRQNVNLRVGYDFMWGARMALAPQQIQRQLDSPPRVNVNGGIFFQGISTGLEIFW